MASEPYCDDCGRVAGILIYDPQFRLWICLECAVAQIRIDAIVERHNAEVRRVS
jgi:hypothetical protein